MSKITLEITEVVNGVSITETPITLVGDTLSAAASTTATGVTFTPAGGIVATNVQTALAEVDSEKMNASNGVATDFFTMQGTNGGNIRWQGNANTLKVHDGSILGFGASTSLQDTDMEIFHVSNESYIRDTGAGTLFIQTDGPSITLGSTANNLALSATFVPGGAINLYHNYGKKFETTSNGIDVTGLVEFDSLSGTGAVAITDILDEDNMASNSATALATQQSIKAYVDAQQDTVDTFAEILALSNTTGGTDLSVSTNDKVQFRDAAIYINSSTDGQLDIVADTEIQLAATTVDLNGVLDVSGNIVVGGTVDGRDVASDGTKLDGIETKLNGIEASATADQSNAEIRAAVEAATDSNVFTDADHTKLNGVAANATANVGDITNVIARNGLTGGGTSGAVTVAVDTAVVATAGNTLSLNNKTLNTPVINSPDINGGTVDGVTIGAGTPSTGKFAGFTAQTDQGNISIPTNTSSLNFDRVGTSYLRATDAAGSFTFVTGADNFSTQRLKIANNGAVVFYEDTGATAKLTWSASTEDLNFAHNVKATFGGGDDLQIYHDGSHSYIADVGVGNLWIGGENVHIGNPDADEFYIQTVNNGAVTLFHNNSPKIATTSTGIDVTGTAKATQLNIRTGTSLGTVATLSDDSSLTSWKLTDQSYYTGGGAGGPASNAGLQSAPTGFFVVDNDTSANASTINGFKAFLIGSNNNDGVDEYTLGSAYNIGNMTFVNRKTGLGDASPQDLEVHNNGQYVFVLGNNNTRLRRFTLTTAYAINTLSTDTSGTNQIQNFSIPNTNVPTGFTFGGSGSDYGKKLYVVDSVEDNLQEFALTNAFDISNGVSLVRSIDINDATKGLVTSCTGVRFSADGTKVYLSDNAAGDDITRLNLATPWDISTTSYHEAFYVGAVDLSISGIDIAGTEIYTVDTGSDTVRQYTSNNTGVLLNADSLHIPGSIRATNDITASGLMRVDGQLKATGGCTFGGTTVTGALTLTSGTAAIRLGPEGATGELKVGRSTKTHTVDIHDGATESGETATVNIGTSGASGSTTNINIGGGVGTCTTTIDGDFVIPNETPASATAAGTAGQIVWDEDYIYICTESNTWKRVAIGTW